MIRVSIYYPNSDGAKLDMDYYSTKHMALVSEKLKPMGMQRWEVDKPLSGPGPDTPAPYLAVGHLYFNSVEDFQKAFAAHAQEIMGDAPNYTRIQPQIQVSEVVSG